MTKKAATTKKKLPPGVYADSGKKGGYYIKYDGPRHPDGSRNLKTVRGFRTVSEASRERAKLIDEVKNGSYIEPTKTTVAEYLEDWMKRRELYVKQSTLRNNKRSLKVFIESEIGSTPLSKLTTRQIEIVLEEKIRNGLMASSAASYLNDFNTALNRAVRDKIIRENPGHLAELPVPETEEVTILTPEEASAFLEFVKGDTYEDITILALYSGGRRGELLGLREIDCNFSNNQVTFAQQVVAGPHGEPQDEE